MITEKKIKKQNLKQEDDQILKRVDAQIKVIKKVLDNFDNNKKENNNKEEQTCSE